MLYQEDFADETSSPEDFQFLTGLPGILGEERLPRNPELTKVCVDVAQHCEFRKNRNQIRSTRPDDGTEAPQRQERAGVQRISSLVTHAITMSEFNVV